MLGVHDSCNDLDLFLEEVHDRRHRNQADAGNDNGIELIDETATADAIGREPSGAYGAGKDYRRGGLFPSSLL